MPNINISTVSPSNVFATAKNVVMLAVWAPNPLTQIVVNLVIIFGAMLSSSVGFLVGIPIALTALFFLGVGVVRLIYGLVAR